MNPAIVIIMEQLEQRTTLQPLSPLYSWDEQLETKIESLKQEATSTPMITLIAALHLRNDSLALSHSYAQQIEHDPTGAYWHGIMHRMEGDYWNSNYWFRQAGNHPVMTKIKPIVAQWLQQNWHSKLADSASAHILESFKLNNAWNSMQFTDLVQTCLRSNDAILEELLMHIQTIEIKALFQHTLNALAKS